MFAAEDGREQERDKRLHNRSEHATQHYRWHQTNTAYWWDNQDHVSATSVASKTVGDKEQDYGSIMQLPMGNYQRKSRYSYVIIF